MPLLLSLVLIATGPTRASRTPTPTPFYPAWMFIVTMRRADDVALKGDLINADLSFLTLNTVFSAHEKQEVSLTANRVFRCTEGMGTFFNSERWSTTDDNLTFRINPNAGLITVEAGTGNDKSSWQFSYIKEGTSYRLTEASVVFTYYDVTAKRIRSEDWVAVKGSSATIPWPCPMTIAPIYRPS